MAPISKVVFVSSALDDSIAQTLNACIRGGVSVTVACSGEISSLLTKQAKQIKDEQSVDDILDASTSLVCEAGHKLIKTAAEKGAYTYILGEDGKENDMKAVPSLKQLLRIIAQSYDGAEGTDLLVGYAFKDNREVKLGELGLLPLIPKDGVAFLPLDISAPLEPQLPFGLCLHKGSDFAIPGKDEACIPTFSKEMHTLERFCEEHHIPFVDPLASLTNYVMDRKVLCEALLKLDELDTGTETRVRGAPFAEVTTLDDLASTLQRSGLRLPAIVKPRVACGQDFSHRMALLLRPAGEKDLHVPLPAVATEFVDHDATIHKVYVIGSQVFSSQRNSIPNIGTILGTGDGADLPDHINFDSLKNKFAAMFDEMRRKDTTKARELDMVAVNAGAEWLRKNLKLHLFGFDVCVEHSTGDHVVVDINYFPSFADVSESPSALWAAMKEAASEESHEPHAKRQKQ